MTSSTPGKGHWTLALSGILLVMGALLGLQVHTRVVSRDLLISRNPSEMGVVFSGYQKQLKDYKAEIDQLRRKEAEYEAKAVGGGGMSDLLREQLEYSRIGLGLVPVKGPGITLELADSTTPLSKDMGDDETFVLHDFDLIQAVNELWADGAEAISLNGQRIVAGSAIVCSGRLISVNQETIPPPFIFTAIGDQDKLVQGLNMRGGMLERLRGYTLKVKLTEQKEVTVPAVAISPKFRYARPVVQGEASPSSASSEQEALP